MARRFSPILFDLDGTIADTHPGISEAVNRALADMKLPAITEKQVRRYTGHGVRHLMGHVLHEVLRHDAPELLDQGAELYKKHYEGLCVPGSVIYPGMPELLRTLTVPLALITNKPRVFAQLILDRLDLARCFGAIVAGEDQITRQKPHQWVVECALQGLRMDGKNALMIGDTDQDVQTGVNANIPVCVVAWGFGTPEAAARGQYRAATVDELRAFLLD